MIFFRIFKEVRLKQKIIGEKEYNRILNVDEIAIWLDLNRGTNIEKQLIERLMYIPLETKK